MTARRSSIAGTLLATLTLITFFSMAIARPADCSQDNGASLDSRNSGNEDQQVAKNKSSEPDQEPLKKDNAESKAEAQSDADKKRSGGVSEAEVQQVMAFAKENHPELAGLLEQLRKSRPPEFAKAVRELRQQIQLLERGKERAPTKYPNQLASWKRDSQIRILMARWAKNNDPEIEKEIRALLKERREARRSQLQDDRERLNQQQRKLDEQLLELEKPMDEQVNSEWDQLAKRNRKTKNEK